MSVFLPDPERSRALLVGAARYADEGLPGLPGVANNVADLRELLTDAEHGILPAAGCDVVLDPPDIPTFGQALTLAAQAATDTLIVYYAGHGLLGPGAQGLYLSVSGTNPRLPRFTALAAEVLKSTIGESPAQHRVLLLDCCFSGQAITEVMAVGDDVIVGQMVEPGVYLLTSTPANRPAMAPEGARHTAFTGALIDVLRRAVAAPANGAPITLDGVYHQLLDVARRGRLPTPKQEAQGSTGRLLLARAVGPPPALSLSGAQPPARTVAVDASYDRVVDELRHCLTQAGGRSRGAELLRQETTRVLGALGQARYPLASPDLDPDEVPGAVQDRLESYENDLARLVRLVAACVLHGDEQSDEWWLRAVGRLLAARDGESAEAVGELASARSYPALLVSYSAGVAARAAGRDAAIQAMLGSGGAASGNGRSAVERLLLFRVVAPPVVEAFPVWSGAPPAFGLSIRLRRALEPVFAGTLAEHECATAFEEYECLRSLLELHALDFSAFGEYAVALGRGRSSVDERVGPSLAVGSPLLRAGAFGGQPATAAEARRRLVAAVRARYG